jgi:hypothetical protein
MVFKAPYRNISSVSLRSYWWMKPEYPEKKHQPDKTLSHDVVSNALHYEWDSLCGKSYVLNM